MGLREKIRSRDMAIWMGVIAALWISPCVGASRDLDAEGNLKNASYAHINKDVCPGKTEVITCDFSKLITRDFSKTSKLSKDLKFRKISPNVVTRSKDSLELVLSQEHENTAIVNAANAVHPGGGFLSKGFVQEETLCAVTSLYLSLKEQKKNYPLRKSGIHKILWTTDVKPIIRMTSIPEDESVRFLSHRVLGAFKNGKNVFLNVSEIKRAQSLGVFSLAAPQRDKMREFKHKRFFWDMYQQYTAVLQKFEEHSQGWHPQKGGRLIFTIPGSGAFAKRKDNTLDHEYLTLNVCALASAILMVEPCFEIIIPKSMADRKDLGQEIVGYVTTPWRLMRKLRDYEIHSVLI